MNCTDCDNTVPISDGQYPKYVRPALPPYQKDILRLEDVKTRDPLCRICWEKAKEQCQEHERIPDPNGNKGCYGPLFTCPSCERRVCAGYRGAPDPRCDTCVSEPAGD